MSFSSPSRTTVNVERLAGLVGADRHDQRDAVGDLLALERRRRRRPSSGRRRSAGVPAMTSSISAPEPSRWPVCTLAPITG